MKGFVRLSAALLFLLVFVVNGALVAQIRGPLVVSDKWPECTDLLTWAHDVFRLEGSGKRHGDRQGESAFYLVASFQPSM